MTGTVGIALAGLGRMGRIHAANLATRCPSARLACIVDVAEGAARELGERLGVPWTTSFDEVLADDGIDALALATPTATHAELTARAARAGKHVFCEKPISLDRGATLATLDAVRAAGVTFQVGFHRRFDPDWAAVAERIRAGELGQVHLFRTSLRDMTPPPIAFLAGSGGFFVDVTIHDLDTARWMVGEIVEVSAHADRRTWRSESVGRPQDSEPSASDIHTAVVVVRFEHGGLGVIDNSRAAGYGYECSTEVMGTLATARIDHPQARHYEWRTPGWAAWPVVRDFEQRYPLAYAEELESFATAVRDGRPPKVTGLDALAAFDLATAADLAWRTGRPVTMTPTRTGDGVMYAPPGSVLDI